VPDRRRTPTADWACELVNQNGGPLSQPLLAYERLSGNWAWPQSALAETVVSSSSLRRSPKSFCLLSIVWSSRLGFELMIRPAFMPCRKILQTKRASVLKEGSMKSSSRLGPI